MTDEGKTESAEQQTESESELDASQLLAERDLPRLEALEKQ